MPTATVTLYKAASGAGFSNRQAQKFGTFLEAKVGLGERPVTPAEIVDAARPKRSPIHNAFTWDDQVAAERWRLDEARHLVQHLVVSVPWEDGTETRVRAFHSVTVAGEDEDGPLSRGYVSGEVVWSSPELTDQVVTRAFRELRGWTDRYRTYADLGHVVAHIDWVLEQNGD